MTTPLPCRGVSHLLLALTLALPCAASAKPVPARTPIVIDAAVQGTIKAGTGISYVSNAVTDGCHGNAAQENGILEPGEEALIAVTLTAASLGYTGVSGVLTSSTSGVTILDDTATWPDLSPFVSTTSNAPHFRVSLDRSAACHSSISFQVSVTSNEGGPFLVNFTRPVGYLPVGTGMPIPIPDNDTQGISNTLHVPADLLLTDVNVRVKIDHTYVGDLYLLLRSPLGTFVDLVFRPNPGGSEFGCPDDNLDVTFDDAAEIVAQTHCAGTNPWLIGLAKPSEALSQLNGQSMQGDWVLHVFDWAQVDVGSLVAWELITTPPIPSMCEECDNVTGIPIAAGRLDAGVNQPNPFSRATQIAFQLPRAGHATLRVYTVAGRVVTTLVDGEMSAGPHTVTWDGRDASGTAVASGIYLYRLSSGIEHGTRRMLLVR